MGNSSSSGRGHHDETVDYGCLVPQGVYTGPRDWNQAIVSQLIVARRLAPFYRPLEDYEEDWDDDQILAARKELPDPDNADVVTRIEATNAPSNPHKSKRPGALKEPAKPEAQIYRGAVECPICFLYYPPNINHSRCCDQAICTECFVQIKRAEPTTTHLVSEPAACPYCVQENFGVVYTPPPWRTGLGSDGSVRLIYPSTPAFHMNLTSWFNQSSPWSDSQRASSEPTTVPTHKRRQKSFSADSPEVVTTDQIRPDWEAKLEAVRAAVARRANRRIIMRQVGDRLIPVGVTSGRVHALSPEEAAALGNETAGSRRSRRRQGPQNGQLEQFMGMAGQDLEELMLMEAMRLSLLDHEEHQRKEAEEKKKKAAEEAAGDNGGGNASNELENAAGSQATSGPGPSTLEATSTLRPSNSPNVSSPVSSLSRSGSPSPPKQATLSSQESQQPGRRSWSISRSRTPPPNPVPNLPLSEDNQAAWRDRSSGAPPFSTLNAALTSTSTAAAFLGPSDEQRKSRSITPEPTHAPTPSSSIPSHPTPAQASLPTTTNDIHSLPLPITVEDATPTVAIVDPSPDPIEVNSSTPSVPPAEPHAPAINAEAPQSSSPISSITTVESETGAGTGVSSSNGFLPSSPGSEMSHEQLSHSATTIEDPSKNGQTAAVSTVVEELSR
uniref:RING-type domain-containing protein n=1 Tax=Psilocybe cubensis TaxID=181762 RepID=A0A8H7Y2W3_PSICU